METIVPGYRERGFGRGLLDAVARTYMFTVLDPARTRSVYDPAQNGQTSDSVTIPSG